MDAPPTEISIRRDFVAEWNTEGIVWEPEEYDKAIIGVAERCGFKPVAVYDYEKLIEVTMEVSDCDFYDAEQHVGRNIIGGSYGDLTPLTLYRPQLLDE
jgi:hypothetical protein